MSSPAPQKNAINWFEIPVSDFDRAVTFYQTILETHLHCTDMHGGKCAFFPADPDGVGGHLWYAPAGHPDPSITSPHGPLLFLNATGRIDEIIARIPAAGGKMMMPKTHIGEPGYIATFHDSEGNRIALHSPQ